MHKLLVATFSLALIVTVGGCKSDNHDHDMDHHDDMSMKSGTSESRAGSTAAGKDECAHCQGDQKLNADGTCPSCKMKMK